MGCALDRDRDNKTMKIHQTEYLKKVLERFRMTECNPAPNQGDQTLTRNIDRNGQLLDAYEAPFRQLIGSLMYAAVGTRPDIAFTVNQLSQFLECPSKEHWLSAKHVLRYLKGTLTDGITYSAVREKNQLTAYSDASRNDSIRFRNEEINFWRLFNDERWYCRLEIKKADHRD